MPPRTSRAGRAVAGVGTMGLVPALGLLALLSSCRGARTSVETYAITPKCELSAGELAAGTPLAVTHVWTVDGSAARVPPGYQVFVHFVGADGGILFTDDHVPVPPPAAWEPGRTYRHTRAVLVPPGVFAGPLEVRVGLFAPGAAGSRLALRGIDRGLQEYMVGTLRVRGPDARHRIIHREGWYGPEAPPGDPFAERRWMGREAVASFRNRKRDVLVMLKGQTNAQALPAGASLRVSIGSSGATIPITSSELAEWRVLFPAAALGTGRWADIRLVASHTFVPRKLGQGDDRELGFYVHALYAGPADELSPLLREGALTAVAVPDGPGQRGAPAGSGS